MASRHKKPTQRNTSSRVKPRNTLQLNRRFENNPFKNKPSRTKLISIEHESILKQFSSTHFAAASSNANDIPPETQKLLSSIGKFDEKEANDDAEIITYGDSSSSSNVNEETNGMQEVDDAPLIFEFPYYLNTISRNLIIIKQRFMQQQKVEALKLAIQSARFLIDDLVLSEAQFYPAIYVLVSKLLDTFGALVYERLYSLAVFGGDTSINEQYAHNFIPQTAAAATATPATDTADSERISDHIDFKPNVYDMDDMKSESTESLPPNFRASHCSMLCQIKCGNWFFKISAIRELVPRILVEISLYRTLRFLYPLRELLSYTKMLLKRLRGISNPLVAGYVTIFALEQIFITFGTNSFVYDDDLINEKHANNMEPIRMDDNSKQYMDNSEETAFDFDMIEDIYLTAFHDVLFIFKSMYDTNFMFVECVFYGQMASEDYLNLFNPIFSMIFDILKYNKVLQNVNDIKIFLKQNINPELLKLIDCDAFLGINKSRNRNDPHYAFNLGPSKNVYNKHNVLNEIANNFDDIDANTQYVD